MNVKLTGGLLLALAGCASAQVSYTSMALPTGNTLKSDFGMLTGVSAADYDNDGDIDLFLPTGEGFPDRLYRNDGSGSFEDVAAAAGVTGIGRARISLFFDYDGDGKLDLVVGRDCHLLSCPTLQTITLYRQGDGGVFEDVTAAAGLTGHKSTNVGTHMSAFSAGDLNNDGWVDLIMGTWNGTIFVFENNGNGTFTDITAASGLAHGVSFYWQPVIADYNNDGWQDIFIGMDFVEDELWINQGNGTFIDIAASANCEITWNGMGVSIGDIENDGDWDIYCTNISTADNLKWSCLYDNIGGAENPGFVESAKGVGVDASGWGWGNTFHDYDLDGHIDLAVTNGRTGGIWQADASRVYRNALHETGTFQNKSDEAGFNDTFVSSTVISADLDRDGDLDLIHTSTNDGSGATNGQIRVLESNAADIQSGNWLVVRPRMTGPNSHALGTVVRVLADGATQMRVITAGISMQGQEPAEAHFGLGAASVAQNVFIEWPNGQTTVLSNVANGQIIDVVAPLCGADLDASGQIDSSDLNAVLASFGTAGPAGDADGDGFVGSLDLNAVLVEFGGPCGL